MNYVDRTDNFMRSLGVEAYRVGGSVRDELLGRRIKDADYMVRGVSLDKLYLLLAAQGVSVSKLSLRDGQQGGWRVTKKGLGLIEIMLPRTERSTGPGHGDFELVIDPDLTLREDAVRRDFTFNALYKIVHEGQSALIAREGGGVIENVIDPTECGLYDLSHKIIRTTHPDSFRDDPLRTLRALRFVSTLGYDLSRDTQIQMGLDAKAVTGLSAKGYASGTVLDELERLLMGEFPAKALRLMRDTGVMAVLFPELARMLGYEQGSRYHDLTTDEHTFKALETAVHVGAPLRVRLALLFHDAGKPESAWVGSDGRKHYYAAKVTMNDSETWENYEALTEDHEVVSERLWRKAADRLNAPARLREDVARLIRDHMVPLDGKFKPSKVRRGRVKYGDEFLRDLYLHRACDESGKGKLPKDRIERIRVMEEARAAAQAAGVPCSPRDLEINGHDLIELGVKGRDIGRVLGAVLDEVAVDPTDLKRSRDWQLNRAVQLRGDLTPDWV